MTLNSSDVVAEIQDILQNYDLGDLVDIERNERGYININYLIETMKAGRKSKYFLRRYKSGIQETEIEFEHSIINHISAQGFSLVARVIETRQGDTYLIRFEDDLLIFYAVFEYLEGEDKYTWIDPKCSPSELSNAAAILARLHGAVVDLKPKGRRIEPKILELLPQIADRIQQGPGLSKGTEFDSYLLEHSPLILRNCKITQQKLISEGAAGWPQLVIHSDYHPGNLKFEGVEVVGLCDFDSSKIDFRCFDVALAIWYFVTDWVQGRDGQIRLRDFELFLDAYQSNLHQFPEIDPLSEIELSNLPLMINTASLYILNWTVTDYYSNDVPPDEYLVYLRHSVNFCQWYEQEGEQLLTGSIDS